ncbi:DUF3515 family protein [Planctomonas psychrotolerans]|uniref:DUF3515 family protein n=1 Tax=Planctomonas psychrotolerans TaxID=2528712 RepID=UPI001238AA56|nr:DUF3515 family protein [Planctomonas psychrotolerans]
MKPPRRSARTRAGKSRLLPLFGALCGVTLLSACTSAVPMEAAEDATDPDCAAVIVRLPVEVADLAIRETDAQATAAWGDPAKALLRCGVTPPGPTTDRCFGIDGIDWVQDASRTPLNTYTTYGRVPAVEVFVDETPGSGVSASSVLIGLTDAVGTIDPTGGCTDPEIVAPSETPAP